MKELILDANTWSAVFSVDNINHCDFEPVRVAILEGVRRLVWGGSKYKQELESSPKYLKLHLEFEKAGLAKRIDPERVDREEANVAGAESDPDFDDAHLIAIEIVARTGLFISCDRRFHPFAKKKKLYPKNFPRPKIYSSLKNRSLL